MHVTRFIILDPQLLNAMKEKHVKNIVFFLFFVNNIV